MNEIITNRPYDLHITRPVFLIVLMFVEFSESEPAAKRDIPCSPHPKALNPADTSLHFYT
jgi:hypothetical protein